MAKLTLNFIDTTRGIAIPNIDIEVQKIRDGSWQALAESNTDVNGNIAIKDPEGDMSGYYEATAHLGDYFVDAGYSLPKLKFVDVLPIRFGIAEPDDDTTITIAVTPYGYSFQAK